MAKVDWFMKMFLLLKEDIRDCVAVPQLATMLGAQRVHTSISISPAPATHQPCRHHGNNVRESRAVSSLGGAISKHRWRIARIKPAEATVASNAADDEVARLREENAALRRQLAERLDLLRPSQRDAVLEQHHDLIQEAKDVGEHIAPLLTNSGANSGAESEKPVEQQEQDEVDGEPDTDSKPSYVASFQPDVPVTIEIDRDEAVVFKFGDPSSPVTTTISNRGSATAMAASGDPPGSSQETVVFRFEDVAGSDPVPQGEATGMPKDESTVTSAAAAAAAAAAGDGVASIESLSSSNEVEEASGSTRGSATTKRGRARAAEKPKSTRKRASTPTPKPAAKKDPLAEARAAATAQANTHDPAEALSGKEEWLYATVPATPVAGATCVLYFNRAQSGVLRDRPHLELMVGFNDWELRPSTATDRAQFVPVDGVPRTDGTDFWRVVVEVPADAYEVQFVVGDGEGSFDNNENQNYHLAVDGPMTREAWIEAAPERAEAAYLARREAERLAAEEEAKVREEEALKADAQRAVETVAELKARHEEWVSAAAKDGVDPLWRVAAPAVAGDKVRLMYNRTAGSLDWLEIPSDQQLVLKVGHNGWKHPQDVLMTRADGVKDAGDWWEATIDVPESAVALEFAVQYYEHFDNNNGADHRLAVSLPAGATSVEAWADGLLESIRTSLTASRRDAETAAAAVEEAKRVEREAARAKAREVRRKQMRHVLFTEPSAPVAGRQLTIYYNPDNTTLHGAQQVFMRGGYNHWRHPRSYGPLELTPPTAGGTHHTLTLTVPKDAYSLDFVFSDAAEDGRYDNRGGLDYHLPVENSVVAETPLYVVHIAVEMAPICKVGGLGDVVTALGRAVQDQGHLVEVVLPRYDFFLASPLLGGTHYETEFEWAGTRIFVSTCVVEGLRCWFIEPANGMFSGVEVYRGGAQDPGRFAFFCRAALEFLLRTQRQPDILHCHDWSSAEVARAYWTEYHAFGLYRPKVVFTIHNLNYGVQAIGEAAHHCQRFTTVSPTYAWEIGGEPAVAPQVGKLMGIRNGIDGDIWDPETDQFVPRGYNAESCVEGKAAAREELRRRLGLTGWGDKPLVAVVSRLTKQKGTHLIAHAAWRTLDRGGQFVLLGSAPDPKVQAEFDALAGQCAGENAAFCFAFDEPLSHLIYAAADIVLVPSMFEPCGLTQMIAMRYGAVPVVRHTGGLRDTVFDVDHDQARAAWELEGSTDWQGDGVEATNGFAFEGTDPGALDYALNRALDAFYNDQMWFRGLQRRVMLQDWSWNKPGEEYVELYHAALKQ